MSHRNLNHLLLATRALNDDHSALDFAVHQLVHYQVAAAWRQSPVFEGEHAGSVKKVARRQHSAGLHFKEGKAPLAVLEDHHTSDAVKPPQNLKIMHPTCYCRNLEGLYDVLGLQKYQAELPVVVAQDCAAVR